jgi:hypothetical protein
MDIELSTNAVRKGILVKDNVIHTLITYFLSEQKGNTFLKADTNSNHQIGNHAMCEPINHRTYKHFLEGQMDMCGPPT